MNRVTRDWQISTLCSMEPAIDPSPTYQRTPVWSIYKKKLLIDSIFRDYDIPKIYLREIDGDAYKYEVVDGQQRLRTIWEFLKDEFSTAPELADIVSSTSGKKYSELSHDLQLVFSQYKFSVVRISQSTPEKEVTELFLRLQEGVSLNPAEKRNAMLGLMRDYVNHLAERPVWSLTYLNNNRFGYQNYVAHVVCLELAGGPCDIKAQDLWKMYKDNNETFNPKSKEGKKVIRVLNFMNLIFRTDTPEMKIKWGFVDLYLLISYIMDNYSVRATNEYADRFREFFVKFESDRLPRVHNPSALLDAPSDVWKRDLYKYIINFQMSAGTKFNIQNRHQVYLCYFLRDNQDLVAKDPTRLFTAAERVILWRRAEEKCEICGDPIAFDDMEGGHIIAHADGGVTELSNGQCECRGRHR